MPNVLNTPDDELSVLRRKLAALDWALAQEPMVAPATGRRITPTQRGEQLKMQDLAAKQAQRSQVLSRIADLEAQNG